MGVMYTYMHMRFSFAQKRTRKVLQIAFRPSANIFFFFYRSCTQNFVLAVILFFFLIFRSDAERPHFLQAHRNKVAGPIKKKQGGGARRGVQRDSEIYEPLKPLIDIRGAM